MKNIDKIIFIFLVLVSSCLTGTASGDIPANPYRAPMYWSVYEYNFTKEKEGVQDNYIPESVWLANIDWVDENLKQLGYNMICIDGWGDVDYNEYGYRTRHSRHWEHNYAWWSAELQKRGMELGIYDNPLWISKAAGEQGFTVKGRTDVQIKSLIDYSEESLFGFTWVQVDRDGAEEYVKGYVEHYAEMGVKYLRVDFLSWYESGWDDNLGVVGKQDRSVQHYETALRWMREACDEHGVFLSLVMPNLKNDAGLEQKYGHMIRINEDTAEGEWKRFSDNDRGNQKENWSQFRNPFDGFIYWSKIAGRDKIILDGDFLRLNTMANDEERKTVVTLNVMAGGPVTVSDQYNTIGNNLWIYQNAELLALTHDGFVGKPLSNDPKVNPGSQVWKGQMSNGDWIVAFFNRELTSQTRILNFSGELGFSGGYVRDLWAHEDLGVKTSLVQAIPSHGCKIFRISANADQVPTPLFSLKGGLFDEALQVELSAVDGAEIFYTTDGSDPSSESHLYNSPVEIGRNTVIKAIAVKDGSISFVGSETYTVLSGESAETAMYVGGTFNNWTLGSALMQYKGNYNWESDPIHIDYGTHEFKFANTDNWSGNDWGNSTGMMGTAELTTGGFPNISITVGEAADYVFKFNDRTLAYSVSKNRGSSLNEIRQSFSQVIPAGDKTFTLTGAENSSVFIYNLQGMLIQALKEVKTSQLIDMGQNPKGIYIVQIVKDHFLKDIHKIVLV